VCFFRRCVALLVPAPPSFTLGNAPHAATARRPPPPTVTRPPPSASIIAATGVAGACSVGAA
jgi:hypothetical protein